MTDRPIIFSAPMVLALLAGRKTMTRRLAWSEPVGLYITHAEAGAMIRKGWKVSGEDDTGHRIGWRPSPWQKVGAGDRLWVRENFYVGSGFDGEKFGYAADLPADESPPRLTPCIHMPRHLSRVTLDVQGTKTERLQEITEADAIAEGIEYRHNCYGTWNPNGTMRCGGAQNAVEAFRCLWTNLHGAGAWDLNPEVVAPSFRVIKANIDEVSPPAQTHVGRLARGA
jgi:hypothetical protein